MAEHCHYCTYLSVPRTWNYITSLGRGLNPVCTLTGALLLGPVFPQARHATSRKGLSDLRTPAAVRLGLGSPGNTPAIAAMICVDTVRCPQPAPTGIYTSRHLRTTRALDHPCTWFCMPRMGSLLIGGAETSDQAPVAYFPVLAFVPWSPSSLALIQVLCLKYRCTPQKTRDPLHFWWVTAVVNLKRLESVSNLPHQQISAQCLGAHVINSAHDDATPGTIWES